MAGGRLLLYLFKKQLGSRLPGMQLLLMLASAALGVEPSSTVVEGKGSVAAVTSTAGKVASTNVTGECDYHKWLTRFGSSVRQK